MTDLRPTHPSDNRQDTTTVLLPVVRPRRWRSCLLTAGAIIFILALVIILIKAVMP